MKKNHPPPDHPHPCHGMRRPHVPSSWFTRLFLPILGLASLIWMLLRILPKPSRAEYPCMKVAAPLAGGFLAYVAALAAALFSFGKAREALRRARYLPALALASAGLLLAAFALMVPKTPTYAEVTAVDSLFVPIDPPNTPMGTARGIFPGRVIWMWDSTATTWNGITGNWWQDANTHQDVVDAMVSKSLHAITGKSTDQAAWDTLFRYFNLTHGKGDVGYRPAEKIAVKLNQVTTGSGWPSGNAAYAAPQTILAMTRQLVNAAGVPDSNITFYDTDRYIPDPIYNKVHAAYPGVHFMGWEKINGREKYVRDTTRVYWSKALTEEINGGNPAYLPTVVTKAAYLINLGCFKAHRYMGVTLCAKNHFGTLSVSDSTGAPYQNAPHAAGLHVYTAVHDIYIKDSPEWTFKGNPMGSYNTLVDLMGHRDLGAKTLLFMIDGLHGVEQEGAQVSNNSRWLMPPFNNHWTSSLFMSLDNLAIESVGIDFFRTEQSMNKNYTYTYGSVDNYLHEAALADDPPSGTFYHPNGDSVRLRSLGVHEHWNNAADRQYSRNLGTGGGIELVQLKNALTSVEGSAQPRTFVLEQNYPNPFNPNTTISWRLERRGQVRLAVYDMLGREVALLVAEEQQAGLHRAQFDGARLASAVYYYRLTSSGQSVTKSMALVK